MIEFWIALIVFFASHSVIARSGLRRVLVKQLGEDAYLIVYSLFSIFLLGWLIIAAQNAPRSTLWPWLHELYWFPVLFMPLACILLVAGFIVPNPLSIMPREKGFDPDKPGLIVAATRHPVLWGFFFWAACHIPPNGTWPLAFMFFLFAIFALAGTALVDRKRKRELGAAQWEHLARNTRKMIFTSPALWERRCRIEYSDLISIAGGLALYIILFKLHPVLFRMDPTPPPLPF